MKKGEWTDGSYWAEVTHRTIEHYPKIRSIIFGGGEIEKPFEKFMNEKQARAALDEYVFEG